MIMLSKATRINKMDSCLNCIAKLAITTTRNNDLLDFSFKNIIKDNMNIAPNRAVEGSAAVVLNHNKFCGIKAYINAEKIPIL